MGTQELEWWGYQHINGTYQVKRYFDKMGGQQDIVEANESPFCKIVEGPFMAGDRDDAIVQLKNLIQYMEFFKGDIVKKYVPQKITSWNRK